MTEVEGWLHPNVGVAMQKLIREIRPTVCVEIGVYGGKSLINTAEALRENRHGIVYGIDPWKNSEAIKNVGDHENDLMTWSDPNLDLDAIHFNCMRAIWERDLDNYVVIIRAPSQYCHKLFYRYSLPIDILYIDGGHSEEASCRDVALYEESVRPKGYIWFDDTHWPSTQKAQEMLEPFCKVEQDFGFCKLFRKY